MKLKHKFASVLADEADATLIQPSHWNDEHDVIEPVGALAIVSGVVTVDLSAADFFTLALSANVTSWVFANNPGAGRGYSKVIRITQHASAAKTMALPTGTWDGTAPAISTTLGAVQLMGVLSFDNGTTRDLSLSGVRA